MVAPRNKMKVSIMFQSMSSLVILSYELNCLYISVLKHNNGFQAVSRVLTQLSIHPSYDCHTDSSRIEAKRIVKSDDKSDVKI
jgi:hypothetical protein